jgi:predicted O-linked N-acetylglucosamine transferase (SPINDLY family)
VFARHPSPVQVAWLGYLNTSGIRAVDYRISDRFTDPEETAERFHTERVQPMPHSQWCYAPVYDVPIKADSRPGGLRFGSFNQFAKLSPACLDLWSRVLNALPEARLTVLDVPEGRTRTRFVEAMTGRGIRADRIDLHGRLDIRSYFAAIEEVDIALDSLPYNGATTTLDTLWMGTPVVALRGDRGISRGSYSILRTLGAPELIADSEDDYVAVNVRLARDADWRARLRSTLRGRLEASPLMDAPRFVADLEAGYRSMWRAWCAARQSPG